MPFQAANTAPHYTILKIGSTVKVISAITLYLCIYSEMVYVLGRDMYTTVDDEYICQVV